MWGFIVFLAATLGLIAIIKDTVSFVRNSSQTSNMSNLGYYTGESTSWSFGDFFVDGTNSYDSGSNCDASGLDVSGGCDSGSS